MISVRLLGLCSIRYKVEPTADTNTTLITAPTESNAATLRFRHRFERLKVNSATPQARNNERSGDGQRKHERGRKRRDGQEPREHDHPKRCDDE
jgi:hypothetical protein